MLKLLWLKAPFAAKIVKFILGQFYLLDRNKMENFLVEHEIWIKVLTLVAAIIIGVLQILINNRLKKLQDFVAIAAVPGPEGKIKIINTGKINLYLCGFDIPGNIQRLNKPRLLSVGTYESAWYWIDPPRDLKEGTEFLITLYIEDQFKQKWISEHGGILKKITMRKEEKEETVPVIMVWSYRTYKKKWSFSDD